MRLPTNRPSDHLRRLPGEFYRGYASVHWIMTVRDREAGWLTALHHAKLREALLHTLSRYGLLCPVYCLMPDHGHFLWMGLTQSSDQRRAAAFFRRSWNELLQTNGCSLQKQAYDHVLRDEELAEQDLFVAICEYVAENPVASGVVEARADWPFWGAIVPGYPRLDPRDEDFWDRFWKIRSSEIE